MAQLLAQSRPSRLAAALAIIAGSGTLAVDGALAQDDGAVTLPGITVTGTRLVPGPGRGPARSGTPSSGTSTPAEPAPAAEDGASSGAVAGTIVTGASTTVITRADLARSPGQTVQDVLAREPGIQVSSQFGSVNGARSTVDMRGFGATGPLNTLVLINGRRLNDIDIASIDFSVIPLDSIERIEITRGNSGGVLYGDGAVGGVINIVTRSGVNQPFSGRVQGQVGSYRYGEADASLSGSNGPFAASVAGNAISAGGYRLNNKLHQQDMVGDFRWSDGQGTGAYFNLSGDDQHLGLPGGRLVTPTSSQLVTDPRGAATPFDYSNKQGINATLGVTRVLAPGTELIVDGGVRQKNQQAAFFCTGCSDFDRGFKATLTTFSLTPRLSSQHDLGGMPGKLIAGIDFYDNTYGSDRSLHLNDPPIHRYDVTQDTLASYFMETVSVLPRTDLSFGARLQANHTTAGDRLDPTAPGTSCLFCTPDPQGLPLDKRETQHALHVGLEHRLNEAFSVFARAARSFRVPTVDERIGVAPSGFNIPTNFDLKTQTSHDIEGGVRFRYGAFSLQTSIYDMWLKDELFFSPATFTNTNLDPTHRYGTETIATWQVSNTVRLKGGLAYTRSVFNEGPFAGNDVPLVSRWSGSAGVSWDVYRKYLVFDTVARMFGPRRMDNDSANVQPLIPGKTIVDARIGGQYEKFFWSLSVQNVFNVNYFEYAIASTFTLGNYNAYPLPGRTVLAKAGVTW
jgi:iron complex outermembrane receptor protein